MATVMESTSIEWAEREQVEKAIRRLMNEARYFDQLSQQFSTYTRLLSKHAKDCRQVAASVENKFLQGEPNLIKAALRTAKVFLNEGRRLRLKLRINLLQQETTGLELEARRWPDLEPMFRSLANQAREEIGNSKRVIESGTVEQIEACLLLATHLYDQSLSLRQQQKVERRKAAIQELQLRIDELALQADQLIEKIETYPSLENKYEQLSSHCLQAAETLSLRLKNASVGALEQATMKADTFLQRISSSQEKSERQAQDKTNAGDQPEPAEDEQNDAIKTANESAVLTKEQADQKTDELLENDTAEKVSQEEEQGEAQASHPELDQDDKQEPLVSKKDEGIITYPLASSAHLKDLFSKKIVTDEGLKADPIETTSELAAHEDKSPVATAEPTDHSSVADGKPNAYKLSMLSNEVVYPRVIDREILELAPSSDQAIDVNFNQIESRGYEGKFQGFFAFIYQTLSWLFSSFNQFFINSLQILVRTTERVFIFVVAALVVLTIVFVLTYLSGSGYSSIGLL